MKRRVALGRCAAAVAAFTAARVLADPRFPSAPVRIIITAPVGGGSDVMMRMYAEKLREAWGQPVLIDPRPGANGAIGVQALKRAPADGHTILYANSNLASAVATDATAGYKFADLAPVSLVCTIPLALGVRASLGVSIFKDYIARAKVHPGRMTYASTGHGTSTHFLGELLNAEAGIDVSHIPYKGEATAIQDTLGGQVDAVITSVGTMARHADRIRMLAVAGTGRFAGNRDVPTFEELNLPAVNLPGWGAAVVAAATPRPIVEALSKEFERVTRIPEIGRRLGELGAQPLGQDPERLAAVMRETYDRYARLVAEGRVKI